MDGYKVRNLTKDRPRKILLSLSLGVSSITLLHLLDQQLRLQKERTGRTGYTLHVLYVEEFLGSTEKSAPKFMESLQAKYAQHSFTACSVEEAYRYSPSFGLPAIDTLLQPFRLSRSPTPAKDLRDILAALPSPSSRRDFIHIIRNRLVIGFAKNAECESVIWGDSTTRLAERTLAETAKGRGFSIPWQTANGLSPHGVNFIFPMRDLLRKEIIIYSTLTSPPLSDMALESTRPQSGHVFSRETTIDDLMSQYFESVELNYPSIVANVVRTSGKLKPAATLSLSALCSICGLPAVEDSQGLHAWGGNQGSTKESFSTTPASSVELDVTCYGCSRSVGDLINLPIRKSLP